MNPVAITQSLCSLGAWVPSLCLHHLAGLHPGPGVWRGDPEGSSVLAACPGGFLEL